MAKTETKKAAPKPMEPGALFRSLSAGQRMGIETLCQRTGLDQAEVLRLLFETGLYVVGLDLPGVSAFEFLLVAAVGEENLSDALTEGADINGLQLAQLVADAEVRTRRTQRSYLAKPKPAQAEA